MENWQNLKKTRLISSGITNNATVLFITSEGLTNAAERIINSKPYKGLGGVHLNQIKMEVN